MLLNTCRDGENGEYYTLPGGGQNLYETLEEAVVRECLEETGYMVKPVRFAALYEEIFDVPTIRESHPDYAHRVYHLFVCEWLGGEPGVPTANDLMQTGVEWVEISRLGTVRLLPEVFGANIQRILSAGAPIDLGSGHARKNHG